MIDNAVSGAFTHRHTPLQIGLALVARDKSIIEVFHGYGVTCSYDEAIRFKSSAAHTAARNTKKLGLSKNAAGLIQVVNDNLDANLLSPNGMQSIHTLVTLVMHTYLTFYMLLILVFYYTN